MVASSLLVACVPPAVEPAEGNATPDAAADTDADANRDAAAADAMPPVDAAPVPVTLAQTTTTELVATAKLACRENLNTLENAFYRVFDLATDHGITKRFRISEVTFGVTDVIGAQSVIVRIGTYAGAIANTLDTGAGDFGGLVTQLAQTTVALAPTPIGLVTTPIAAEVPAGSTLIVEVFSPRAPDGTFFFLGGTASSETRPAYVRAPGCGVNVPATTTAINLPQSRLVITATGTVVD